MLEHNGQDVPPGEARILDRLVDCMAFGAPKRCPECRSGQLVFSSAGFYRCTGQMSEWAACTYTTFLPARNPFRVPEEFTESPFLYAYLSFPMSCVN